MARVPCHKCNPECSKKLQDLNPDGIHIKCARTMAQIITTVTTQKQLTSTVHNILVVLSVLNFSGATPFPMFEAINLSCVRDERVLFHGLSFSVNPGDIVQIEGPNGAGKTSLLRLLAGLSQPAEGEIHWQGEAVRRQRDVWHQALLYLGHQPGVKGVLTPLENLRFFHPNCDQDSIFAALESVDLLGYEEIPVAQLSAGQQRRVALARLWLTRATLWILDEPLTAIDKSGVEKLMRCFTRHAENGGAVILTTHQDLPASKARVRQIRLQGAELA